VSSGIPDVLIVGGGSAGAVLAARLSENLASRVLLIEAGPDTPPGGVPADVADLFPSSSLNPSYFWPGLQAQRRDGGPLHSYPQARIMGGGSSIMGMWALRGLPSDFEAWEAAGAEGWGPGDVVKAYRRVENDLDRDNTQAALKPYTIRRVPHEDWPPFTTAMERAAHARGLPAIGDINEDPRAGFFPLPLSHGDTRSSSASTYLTSDVRRRPNLEIMPDTQVTRLRFAGTRAIGVTMRRGGETKDIDAREVILSSGAIHSPAMLMRSGVGPGDELQRHGIAPVAVRAGVGRNLQNHPYLNIAMTLPSGQRMDQSLRHFALAGMRISSGLKDCPPADLVVFAIARVSGRSWGPSLAMVGASVYAPFSRGHVTLNGPDIDVRPAVAFQFMSDPRDAPRMVQATRFAESLLMETAMKDTFNDAFLLPPIMALNQFDRPGVVGSIMAQAATLLLNAPPAISRFVLKRMLAPGRWIGNAKGRQALTDDEIVGAVAPMGHVTSTCSIGRPDNPFAVVDKNCRVYGVDNLRVVDASVMPSVPSANTNLTTIMVAERAAELIASGAR
jgi:5-(hydroxymethyl)furfural/furfural oxidase